MNPSSSFILFTLQLLWLAAERRAKEIAKEEKIQKIKTEVRIIFNFYRISVLKLV